MVQILCVGLFNGPHLLGPILQPLSKPIVIAFFVAGFLLVLGSAAGLISHMGVKGLT